MLIGEIRPTTLAGVKSLAAQLRKERGIKHSNALDLAAQAANCTNFRNAKKTLPATARRFSNAYVLLTAYWTDKDRGYLRGRETLRIDLPKAILEICEKQVLKNVRGFSGLRMVADDHFVADMVGNSQEQAREGLCAAHRSLRFMECTGLRPARNHREANPRLLADDRLPNRDHATSWIDPTNGQFILVDEPYGDRPDNAERRAWSDRTGWSIDKASWPGMYRPFECDLFVVTDRASGYDVEALLAKINAMEMPLVQEHWAGASSESWDTFVSPLAVTPQDVRRAKCRGTVYPVSTAKTVPFSYNVGALGRRPAARMQVPSHIVAGHLLKAILNSRSTPYGVYRRLNSVRSTLEDWLSLEATPGQLERLDFFAVYYSKADGDQTYDAKAASTGGIRGMLEELKTTLLASYPDCAPLRKQLNRVQKSIDLMHGTKPAAA